MLIQSRTEDLRKLLDLCLSSAPDDEVELLCEAGMLLVAPDQFTALLRANACESAALSLIGDDSGWMLSRGAGGTALASVLLAQSGQDVSAQAATPALALLAALLAAMLSANTGFAASTS